MVRKSSGYMVLAFHWQYISKLQLLFFTYYIVLSMKINIPCHTTAIHTTFLNRSRSIANGSRPVARVHTGETETLVPVSVFGPVSVCLSVILVPQPNCRPACVVASIHILVVTKRNSERDQQGYNGCSQLDQLRHWPFNRPMCVVVGHPNALCR